MEETVSPVAGANEVLVRILAAGVGPWDAWVRSGKSRIDQPLPLTLGSDIAGRVEAVGAGVRGIDVGDAVYGVTNERFTGGYAELAAVSAEGIAPIPRRLDAVGAASVPVVAVTAEQMLFDHGQLRGDERVLIHGAGGNVGAYALQLAKATGAEVVGMDRGGALDYARTLDGGVLDAATDDFTARGPFDLVVDTVGGDDLQRRSMSYATFVFSTTWDYPLRPETAFFSFTRWKPKVQSLQRPRSRASDGRKSQFVDDLGQNRLSSQDRATSRSTRPSSPARVASIVPGSCVSSAARKAAIASPSSVRFEPISST